MCPSEGGLQPRSRAQGGWPEDPDWLTTAATRHGVMSNAEMVASCKSLRSCEVTTECAPGYNQSGQPQAVGKVHGLFVGHPSHGLLKGSC